MQQNILKTQVLKPVVRKIGPNCYHSSMTLAKHPRFTSTDSIAKRLHQLAKPIKTKVRPGESLMSHERSKVKIPILSDKNLAGYKIPKVKRND